MGDRLVRAVILKLQKNPKITENVLTLAKNGLATIWAIFSKTHLATLVPTELDATIS
jgi:hypothetical protein